MFVFILILNLLKLSTEKVLLVESPSESPVRRFQDIKPTPSDQLLTEDKNYWFNQGGQQLAKNVKISYEEIKPVAKNVVVMIGDGMGISTVTAARIYKGQRYFGKSGEDHNLVFDTMPNVGLVKTYNVNMQVPDSAGTATALFTGVKTRYRSLGLDARCNTTVLDETVFEESKVDSIMTWAQDAQKDTGIITTTRITHATPAATYAHSPHRDWECDAEVPQEAKGFIKDIARQLIEDAPGKNFKVIMGGGHQQFGFRAEYESNKCTRTDNLNLTQIWLAGHDPTTSILATNNAQLDQTNDKTEHILGLFDSNHLPYDSLRDKGPNGTPSLTKMVAKALQVLNKAQNGFVLLIEGGKIDKGHHDNFARFALQEATEFDDAVALVLKETGPDTMVIVTADHSHTMTLNGYASRGNDILGYGLTDSDNDHQPSLTLTYANGRGFDYHFIGNQSENSSAIWPWRDVTTDDDNRLNNPEYRHLGAFRRDDETHGGEDVGIYATGPGSHLIRGVMEQSYVAHVIGYSACIGPRGKENPKCQKGVPERSTSGGEANVVSVFMINVFLLTLLVQLSR